MVRGFSFSDNIAHIIEEFSAQVGVGVNSRVHDKVVASPLKLIFYNELLLHYETYGKLDFTSIRGLVCEHLVQAFHEQVPRIEIFGDREFLDPVFSRGDRNAFPITKKNILGGFIVGATRLSKILLTGSYFVVCQEDDNKT